MTTAQITLAAALAAVVWWMLVTAGLIWLRSSDERVRDRGDALLGWLAGAPVIVRVVRAALAATRTAAAIARRLGPARTIGGAIIITGLAGWIIGVLS